MDDLEIGARWAGLVLRKRRLLGELRAVDEAFGVLAEIVIQRADLDPAAQTTVMDVPARDTGMHSVRLTAADTQVECPGAAYGCRWADESVDHTHLTSGQVLAYDRLWN
jgi:hypothetical protein